VVQANNYKFHSFRSVYFHPSLGGCSNCFIPDWC